MLSIYRKRWLLGLAAAFVATSVSLSQSMKPQQESKAASGGSGKRLFASSCAACHGLDGKGSERAPNIADGANVRRMSPTRIMGIIQNGIPGTGMPAFHTFSAAQIEALIQHLRTLGGASKPLQLPGDPAAGRKLFAGKAGCSGCHMVLGEGGFIASNLSDYGRDHSIEQIRTAILNPDGSKGRSVRTATITLRNGEQYAGRVRNEDNFSIQLQDVNGAFHLFPRSDVTSFEYDAKSMMPSDYASRLSPKELDDVESYLIDVADHQPKSGAHKANDGDCSPSCTEDN
jgi:cytochrome c oxidase cbb3-type subunit 3